MTTSIGSKVRLRVHQRTRYRNPRQAPLELYVVLPGRFASRLRDFARGRGISEDVAAARLVAQQLVPNRAQRQALGVLELREALRGTR